MPLSFAAQGYFFDKKCSTMSKIGNQNFFNIQRIWGSYFSDAEVTRSLSAPAKRSSSIRQ